MLTFSVSGKRTPIWDALVFRKVRNMLFGPNLKIMISGSAPLSAAVQDFLRWYVARMPTECVDVLTLVRDALLTGLFCVAVCSAVRCCKATV